jgi:hypothetical protein
VCLTIYDRDGHELYTWTVTAPPGAIAGDGSLLFRARLAAPPVEGREVIARFASQDEIASR